MVCALCTNHGAVGRVPTVVAHCDRHQGCCCTRGLDCIHPQHVARRVALDRTPCGLAKPCKGVSAALLGSYRLMRNDEVSPEAIREGGLGCVARQARSHPGVLLAVEGATSVSYAHAVAADLGATGSRREAQHRGYLVRSGRLGQASGGQARGPKPAWMTHLNCAPTGFQ